MRVIRGRGNERARWKILKKIIHEIDSIVRILHAGNCFSKQRCFDNYSEPSCPSRRRAQTFTTWLVLRHKFKNIIGHLENYTNNREKPNPIYINSADYQLLRQQIRVKGSQSGARSTAILE